MTATPRPEPLTPRTEAGRALYDRHRIHNQAQRRKADDRHDAKWLADILAIEHEAAERAARQTSDSGLRGGADATGWRGRESACRPRQR